MLKNLTHGDNIWMHAENEVSVFVLLVRKILFIPSIHFPVTVSRIFIGIFIIIVSIRLQSAILSRIVAKNSHYVTSKMYI